MAGFYMKCNTMLKGINLAFSLLTSKMYLPKHNQILKVFKRYLVDKNFFKIDYKITLMLKSYQ